MQGVIVHRNPKELRKGEVSEPPEKGSRCDSNRWARTIRNKATKRKGQQQTASATAWPKVRCQRHRIAQHLAEGKRQQPLSTTTVLPRDRAAESQRHRMAQMSVPAPPHGRQVWDRTRSITGRRAERDTRYRTGRPQRLAQSSVPAHIQGGTKTITGP